MSLITIQTDQPKTVMKAILSVDRLEELITIKGIENYYSSEVILVDQATIALTPDWHDKIDCLPDSAWLCFSEGKLFLIIYWRLSFFY